MLLLSNKYHFEEEKSLSAEFCKKPKSVAGKDSMQQILCAFMLAEILLECIHCYKEYVDIMTFVYPS